MSANIERQNSKGWLCCVRPAVVEADTAADPAPVSTDAFSSSSVVKGSKATGTGTHVTAHCDTTSHRDQPTDIRAAGADQAGHTLETEPGPAPAAAAGSVAAVMAAKLDSHNKQQDAVIVRPAHPDLKHLMASSFDRPYTDADWDAAMTALEQVKKQNQALALQQLQHSAGHKSGLHRTSYASATSDQWHDAVSHTMSDTSAITDAEQREIEQYLQELEMLRGPAPGPELACTPSCVPDPPLLFAPKHWKWCQVDARPFSGYWERDSVRSTPFPLPIDKQCGLSKLAMRCHESIPGMWLRMEGNQLLLTASPQIIAIPGVMNYTEYFNTDSTLTSWALRRDISLGRSQGQMFMTTDGILVFRVYSSGVFSKTVDWVCEDYMRVEDNGSVIVTKQYHRLPGTGAECSQYLIGRKRGNTPPPKHR